MSDKGTTLKELIESIDFRLTHLEDIEADNRKLLVKLIKQGNQVVNFLKESDSLNVAEDLPHPLKSFALL